MDILFVSEYFYPRIAGGEKWSFELCKGLVEAGHNVTVVTSGDEIEYKGNYETIKGIKIIRICKSGEGESFSFLKRLMFGFRLHKFLKDFLKDNKFDVIHSFAYIASLPASHAAKREGIRSMTSVHQFFGKKWFKVSSFPSALINYMMEKVILGLDESDVIQVPSMCMKEDIKDYTCKKVIVIPNYLEVNEFSRIVKKYNRDKIKKRFGLDKNSLLIVSVGNLYKVKNFDGLIRMANDVLLYDSRLYMEGYVRLTKRKALFIIIGEGNERQHLEKLIKKKKVKLMGGLPREKTLSLIYAADLFINPSHAESFSFAMMEAYHLGTPIISTPTGVSKDLKEKSPERIEIIDNLDDLDVHIPKHFKPILKKYNKKEYIQCFLKNY